MRIIIFAALAALLASCTAEVLLSGDAPAHADDGAAGAAGDSGGECDCPPPAPELEVHERPCDRPDYSESGAWWAMAPQLGDVAGASAIVRRPGGPDLGPEVTGRGEPVVVGDGWVAVRCGLDAEGAREWTATITVW